MKKSPLAVLLFLVFVPVKVRSGPQQPSDAFKPAYLEKVIFKLDGLLDDEVWTSREPLRLTCQICPNEGQLPSETTDFWMVYDRESLYIAARLHEKDARQMMSRSLERDSHTEEQDAIGLVLDTQNDNRTACVFIVTPDGVRTDMAVFEYTDNLNKNTNWNAFWDAATRQDETGWTVEMKVPFSSLRFQVNNGAAVMGMIFWRYLARNREYDTFPAIPNNWKLTSYKPSQALDIEFSHIENHHPLYIRPYILGGVQQQNNLDAGGLAYRMDNSWKKNLGLDLKYNLTSSLILDATLNTDFAQVEADDQQINLTRFSLYFPEKRTFFQERADLFSLQLPGGQNNLFHSRTIGIVGGQEVPILGGLRLTGESGDWQMGFLDMQTGSATIGGERIPSENFGVFRLRRSLFGNDSYVGGMATTRTDFQGQSNVVLAADADIRVKYPYYLTLQFAQGLEHGSRASKSLFSTIKFASRVLRGFYYGFSATHLGTEFNPGVGFLTQTGINRVANQFKYTWFPRLPSPIQRHGFLLHDVWTWNIQRKLFETSERSFGWDFLFRTGATANITLDFKKENIDPGFSLGNIAIPPGRYQALWTEASFETSSGRPFRFLAEGQAGGYYGGSKWTAILSPYWTLSAYLTLNLDYDFSRVKLPQGIYEVHIARFRAKAAFSRALTLSAFIQYNTDLDLVTSNIRLHYNPREGTDLYLVYNEGTNTDLTREIPFLPRSQRRAILIKYSITFIR